jgi:hypothetical protein
LKRPAPLPISPLNYVKRPNDVQSMVFSRRDAFRRRQQVADSMNRRREYAVMLDVYHQAQEQGAFPSAHRVRELAAAVNRQRNVLAGTPCQPQQNPMLDIVKLDHPILRQKGEPVTDFGPALQTLIEEMIVTMREAHGVGLAAPAGRPISTAIGH